MNNFAFDDTQDALRDMSRQLFAKASSPTRLRELWEGAPFDRSVWRRMADAGICGLTVPETLGGGGGTEVDLAVVYEEAGRAALPEPLLETVGLGVPLIATGPDAFRARWLAAIAAGEAIVAVQAPGEDAIAWAGEADLVILADGRAHERSDLTTTPAATLDPTRPAATVDAVSGEGVTLDVSAIGPRASTGIASLLNGIAMAELEMTVTYANDRTQFGRTIGSFQAVKHKLASMHVALETSRPAAWYAAYAVATDAPDAREAASVAHVAAAETEALCNADALQCHGGIGFTWEHDLHLWLKRGMVLRSAFGGTRDHLRSLATAVIDDA